MFQVRLKFIPIIPDDVYYEADCPMFSIGTF